MDRIHSSARPAKPVPGSLDSQIGSASLWRPSGEWPLAVFAPLHYEPNYAYPLIVWLHGPGGDERQVTRIMPMVSLRNYVAVAPQGISTGSPTEDRSVGRYDWLQSWDHIQQAQQRVFDCVEVAAGRYHFSPNRVFLAGFDTGGTMAFRIALSHPRRFAGVLSLCGAFPSGQTPLSHLPEVRRMPIFLAVGRDSTRYSPEEACRDIRLLHTAGLSITLRQYPCRHELSPQMLRDLDRWIIEQITAPREA